MAKTYSRFAAKKLGSGLSVHINKSREKSSGGKPWPKSHYSYGYVNAWDADTAKLLGAHLAAREPEIIFNRSRSLLFRHWELGGGQKALGASLHDLRRASGLFLGRVIAVELTLLRDHLRHSEIETTVLYTRSPANEVEESAGQDWLDVV